MPLTGEMRNEGTPIQEMWDGYDWVPIRYPEDGSVPLRTIDQIPMDPREGQLYYDTDRCTVMINLAGQWMSMTPGMLRAIQDRETQEQEHHNRHQVNQMTITTAQGNHLDTLASFYGLTRFSNDDGQVEDDGHFRQRIRNQMYPREMSPTQMVRINIEDALNNVAGIQRARVSSVEVASNGEFVIRCSFETEFGQAVSIDLHRSPDTPEDPVDRWDQVADEME